MENEVKRRETNREIILRLLREAGSHGVTNVELSDVALRYGGYLGDLYKRGYNITTESLGRGVYKYTLVSEPEEERVETKKAIDILLDAVGELGTVNKEELEWLLDELNLNVRRKANTYKKVG